MIRLIPEAGGDSTSWPACRTAWTSGTTGSDSFFSRIHRLERQRLSHAFSLGLLEYLAGHRDILERDALRLEQGDVVA